MGDGVVKRTGDGGWSGEEDGDCFFYSSTFNHFTPITSHLFFHF